MSEHKDGGPAFPNQPLGRDGLPCSEMLTGMTLRDWFAGQFLSAIHIGGASDADWVEEYGPRHAYRIADAMLKERSK